MWPQGSSVSIRVVRGSTALLSSHGRGIGPQYSFKGEYRGLSWVASGNPGFPRFVKVTSGSFSLCLLEVRHTGDLGGAFQTPLGLVQRMSALSRVEAGSSGFLSCFNVGLVLCMPFQTGSQVSTSVEAWNSAFLLSCQRGFRPPAVLNLGPGALFGLTNRASELLHVVS